MFVLPFALIEKLVAGRAVQGAVIRMLLREVIAGSAFDEMAYLAANPDVAEAVERGELASGHAHFAATGYFEGRPVPVGFSEDWYLAQNPDVAAAVQSGVLESGAAHYFDVGISEWRSPSSAAAADVARWERAVQSMEQDARTWPLARHPAVLEGWRQLRAAPVAAAPVALPVGTLSPKGDLLLGRDGLVFLIGGQDAPLERYGQAPEAVAEVAAAVLEVFARRQEWLAARNTGYLQLVIPEKLSVMHGSFPVPIETPTTLLRMVEAGAAATAGLAGSYLSCLEVLRALDAPFRPVDTHLSPTGAHGLAGAIAERRGLAPPPALVFDRAVTKGADVSDGFFGMLETFHEADPNWAPYCEKVGESRQTLGHFGKRQRWRCAGAANPGKILVFGNSYVEFVEKGQYALSWWLARMFAGYEFSWATGPDWDLVEAVKPDLVICQTVERFLHRIPAT